MPTKLIQAALLIAAACCTGFVHTKIPPRTLQQKGLDFIPTPEVAKVVALGFDAVVADYYWLQAVQVIGGREPISEERGWKVAKLIDVVTTLDPHVSHPYRFAGLWMTESEALVRDANRLLRRGIENHPEDWRQYFYLGFNHYFYLLENEPAADVLEQASKLEGSPVYLPRLVARLRSTTEDIGIAELLLRDMVENTPDPEARAVYEAALDEIEIEHKARFLDEARAAFAKRAGRDITSVSDLVKGPHRVLQTLPSPEPESLPEPLSRNSVWKIDPDSDRIVSTYYGYRYRVQFHPRERARAERWKAERERNEPAAEETGTSTDEG